LPDAVVDVAYDYSFDITGDAPITLGAVTKPSWMTVTLTGNTVTLTGTPVTGDVGTDLPVNIPFTNCTAGAVEFDDIIDVIAYSGDLDYINYTGDAGSVTDVCTLGATFSRTSAAADASTAASERIQATYHIVVDNGYEFDQVVIFEIGDVNVSVPIDASNDGYCAGTTSITCTSVVVIP